MSNEVPPGAVVWDMDGVLVNSGDAHRAAWKALGREIGPSVHRRRLHPDVRHGEPRYLPHHLGHHRPGGCRRLERPQRVLFRDQAPSLQPLPGAVELVRALHAAGWRQAIGSSTPAGQRHPAARRAGADRPARRHCHRRRHHAGQARSAGLLAGLRAAGRAPARGFVLEDAVAGVQAGRAAGAQVIGVTTTRARADLLAAGADRVVDDLTELTVPRLQRRGRRPRPRTPNYLRLWADIP